MSHSNRKKHSQLYFVKMLTMNIGELDFHKREIESFQKEKQVSKKKILAREIVRRKRLYISQQKKLFDLTRQPIPFSISRKPVYLPKLPILSARPRSKTIKEKLIIESTRIPY